MLDPPTATIGVQPVACPAQAGRRLPSLRPQAVSPGPSAAAAQVAPPRRAATAPGCADRMRRRPPRPRCWAHRRQAPRSKHVVPYTAPPMAAPVSTLVAGRGPLAGAPHAAATAPLSFTPAWTPETSAFITAPILGLVHVCVLHDGQFVHGTFVALDRAMSHCP
jgi:pyruvate/2-oxoglutarate dehydrogenase complex dihydrolipoamide acyltransferase (E2) component